MLEQVIADTSMLERIMPEQIVPDHIGGTFALWTPEDLDEWADDILSVPRSTVGARRAYYSEAELRERSACFPRADLEPDCLGYAEDGRLLIGSGLSGLNWGEIED